MKRIEKPYITIKPKLSNKVIIIMMFLATIFMSVGYAAINNVTLTTRGLGNVIIEHSVHVSVATSAHSDSTINSFSGTMLNSTVDLTNHQTETFSVTIYNTTNNDYYFDQVLRDTEQSLFYDNQHITLSLSGLNQNDLLTPGSSVTFTVTFGFENGFTPSSPSDYILNSYINFKFRKGLTVTYNNIDITNKNYPTIALEGTSFSVSFYGDMPYDVKVTSGSSVLTENTHYTYITDPSDSTHKLLTVNNVSNNITIDRYYHITYTLNGGTNNSGNLTKYLAGTSETFLDPSYTKHRFDGWFLDSGFNDRIYNTGGQSGDLVVYAKWTPIYTITYVLNGGENPNNQIVDFTVPSNDNLLNAYHPHDQTFGGWYENSGLTTGPVTSLTGRTSDFTLYAKWTNTINNTTYDNSTYKYTATNASNVSLSSFDSRQYTQNTANVEITNIHIYVTYSVSNGAKTATQTCQVTSNSSGFQTVSDTVNLNKNSTSWDTTLTLDNHIQAGSNYTISCSHTGDGNGKYKVSSFAFIVNE